MPEDIDIKRLLPAWIEERDALNVLIAWAQKKVGSGHRATSDTRHAPNRVIEPTAMPMALEADTFFRMSVPVAIKSYLNIARRPRPALEITEGLKRGGLTTKAKNLYATVYPTLLRMEKAGEVTRIGKEWALAEWYAAGGRKTLLERVQEAKEESEK